MSITLVCLVKGSKSVNAFPIDIDRNKLVGHLKEAIKAKNQQTFGSVDAKDIKLWKVEISDDRDDLLSALSLKDDNELRATRDIEDYWAVKPLKRSIHVIIEQPVAIGM